MLPDTVETLLVYISHLAFWKSSSQMLLKLSLPYFLLFYFVCLFWFGLVGWLVFFCLFVLGVFFVVVVGFFVWLVWFFKAGFLCIALAILEFNQ